MSTIPEKLIRLLELQQYDKLIKEYINSKILENTEATIFTGTMSEYEAADKEGKIPVGCLVFITDDSVSSDASSPILGKGVLGALVLA